MNPEIIGNPLKITVYLLVISYFIGEFILPKYPFIYLINLIGVLSLIISIIFFFFLVLIYLIPIARILYPILILND